MSKSLTIMGLASMLLCFSSISHGVEDSNEARVSKLNCAQDVHLYINNEPFIDLAEILNSGTTIDYLSELTFNLQADRSTENYSALLLAANIVVNTFAGETLLNDTLDTLYNDYDTGSPVTSPRMVITQPDGTVIIDTALYTEVDPDIYASKNTLANWNNKAINENHNSRIAILDSQIWPCGKGVEIKFSSTLGVPQAYVAYRLGEYLLSAGTARLSVSVEY